MNNRRRIPSAVLAVLLSVLMLVALFPVTTFAAQYKDEYYAPTSAQYIYEVGLYYSSDGNGDAEDNLRKNGYTPVGRNFNAGDGKSSKYVHLGVKYTTDATKAIRAFAIYNGSAPASFSKSINGSTCTFYVVGAGGTSYTPYVMDHQVDLNKGAGGDDLQLYATDDPNAGPPITSFEMFQDSNGGNGRNQVTNAGCTPVYNQKNEWQDCNAGCGGDYLYCGYKSSATKVSTTNLRSAYNTAASYLSTTNWTTASVSAVTTARTNALTVTNDFDNHRGISATYNQSAIDTRTTAINTALDNLQIAINFDATTNGGTLSGTPSTLNITTGKSTTKTQSLSSYKATKTGWTFLGWDKSSTSMAGTTGNITAKNGDTYYAIFSKTFNMSYTYLAADGTVAKDERQSIIYNTSTGTSFPYINRPNVVIDGKTYTFAGYRVDTNAAAPSWTSGVYSMKASDGVTSMNVYAVYTTDITLTQNSGKGTPAIDPQTKTQYLASTADHKMTDVSFTLSSVTPTYAGGGFKGWDTSSAAETVVYAPGATVTTKNSVDLYAVYDLYTYTVNFVDEDGTVLKTETVKYGFDATAPAAPVKASDDTNEYTFNGWAGYEDVTSDLTITASYTAVPHVFDITHLVLPSCEGYGADKYVCSNCGYTKTVPVDPKNHSLSTETGFAATCTSAGLTDKIFCTTCGKVMQDSTVIDPLGHDYQLTSTTAPTCSAKGYDIYTCTRCSLTEKRNETAPDYNNHSLAEIPAVESTCTANGATAGTLCTTCGAVVESPKTIIAEGHKWIAATCTTAKTCSVCGKTEGTPHTPVYVETEEKAATCTTVGYSAGKRCKLCNYIPEGSEVVVYDALGHSYGEAVVVDATCSAEGSSTVTCANCGDTVVTVIEKTAHTMQAIPEKEATCTETGSKGGYECAVCGAIIEAPEVIAKADHNLEKVADTVEPTCYAPGKTAVYTCADCGYTKGGTAVPQVNHTFGAWATTVAATCTEDGSKTRTCKFCDVTETKVVTAIGHVAIDVKAVPAKCGVAGMEAGKQCVFCGEYLEGCATIPALIHNYAAVKTVEAKCEAEGYTTYKCANCGDTYNADFVEATGHSETVIAAVEPTCTSLGKTEGAKCTVCGKVTVKPETVAKKDHNKVEYGAVAATCTETGMKAGVMCADCGRIYSTPSEIPAKGHTSDLGTMTAAATCIQEGEITYKCVDCGEILDVNGTGFGKHTLSDDYKLEGGMVTFTCTVCGVEIKTTPSEVGLPDTGCEKCGIHHREGSLLFKYDGFFCKLVYFFRNLFSKIGM